MALHSDTSLQWNIFAKYLRETLASKGFPSLWTMVTKAGIHSQMVSRLVKSLDIPKSFPTLNRDQLRAVRVAYELDDIDMTRLIAAIMATSIEASLVDKISNTVALEAAEKIFPILFEALSADSNFDAVKREFERSPIVMSTSPQEIDEAFRPIFEVFDIGQIAMSMSYVALTTQEQLALVNQARDCFMRSKLAMHDLDPAIQETENWVIWFQEVESSLHTSEKRINQLQKQ